ncbi:sulfite reductase subunit alpha [Brevundimonas sp. SORGH_AS_0993]|uniref:sulfite reductase subunit alpha n=1 Tax=Brevundimonas sp. SORGH_AS_0993 TaxID=3041794 RepID=UPI0027881515|nr:sulfite reductase subunit alpha [Brevundimonas sp. SORGH_AS_0993]MDQ1155582.1 sulfite reductase (NADPH) flavoprotein alpha-component [Brevundimonas sp. SORGH_AS_0993]
MSTDPERWLWAVVALGLWLALIAAIVWRERRARSAAKARSDALAGSDAAPILVAFASQTGFAEELAWMTARALGEGGVGARVLSFADLDLATLKAADRALLIVSTTGEGDPPDAAARFVRRTLAQSVDLTGLRFGLLALGDRSYEHFCGFGHAVDGWLRRSGADPLFDLVEVDNGEAGAIRHWQHQLNQITGQAAAPDWTPPAYEPWRLAERALVNPGSPGGAAYRLAFHPVGAAPDWSAGDIAEIGLPERDGVQPGAREYSIASLPGDGRVEFLIRLMQTPDGTPGLASGWLTQELPVGEVIDMRLRANRSFHGPADETPMILIGNGTGIAGLRAHLKARTAAGGGAWLLFGERTRAHDAFFDVELQGWLASGVLRRLDRSFSRDAGDGRYVQDLIAAAADELRAWVGRGAAIYVCGSLEGMSQGVQAALEQALGADVVLTMLEDGRYRRDVY